MHTALRSYNISNRVTSHNGCYIAHAREQPLKLQTVSWREDEAAKAPTAAKSSVADTREQRGIFQSASQQFMQLQRLVLLTPSSQCFNCW
jgi:hypothetical protein